jgi:DMSO/TMAO reductase YedYZ heme-binding membrane subunit
LQLAVILALKKYHPDTQKPGTLLLLLLLLLLLTSREVWKKKNKDKESKTH